MPQCRCATWCHTRPGIAVLTGHHETCEHRPDLFGSAADLIHALVRGIEDWGAQEDGIPDPLWMAYAKAKAVLGEPVDPTR